MSIRSLLQHVRRKNKHLLGLDVDDGVVRLVEMLHYPEHCQLTTLHHKQFSLLSEAFSWRHPVVKSAITATIEAAQPHTKQVAITLPHHSVLFKTLQLDKTLTDTEIGLQIREHAEQYFGHPLTELMLDFQRLTLPAQNPQLCQIRWVAARRSEVEERISILTDINLEVVAVEVECFSLQRLLWVVSKKQRHLFILIYVASHYVLLMAINAGVSDYTRVENYLATDASALFPITRAVQQYFFQEHLNQSPDFLMIGGGSIDSDLIDQLRQKIDLPIEMINPFLMTSSIELTKYPVHEFCLSAGLAMRQI